MIDRELTAHLAELSKIEFKENELDNMTEDMKSIIALMDKVKDFNADIAPYTLNPVGYDNLRGDAHKNSFPKDKITQNAKNVKNDSFVVPKVV